MRGITWVLLPWLNIKTLIMRCVSQYESAHILDKAQWIDLSVLCN